MANKCFYCKDGKYLDHTPSSAVTAGKIIQVGSLACISPVDIAADALGGPDTIGVWEIPYVGGIASVGDNIWWDATGTPYGGAADGACTNLSAAGDWWLGTLVAPTVAASATAFVKLNFHSDIPNFQGKTTISSAIDLTLVAATHSGGVAKITVAAKTFTLPTGVVGMDFVLVNDAVDASLCTVDLDGNEIIAGANLTIAATKTAVNTALTAKRGDFLHLVCNVAATSWRCVAKRGIWVTS
ncbi:MAG: DUF2190 family protein [Acidobacteria bacterium]|nr:DUF2190 family protein [Acidobacteriota bacterium]